MIASLEDDIELLRQLDIDRIASAKLRDEGYNALIAIVNMDQGSELGSGQEIKLRESTQVLLALCELLSEPSDTLESSKLQEVRQIVKNLADKLENVRPDKVLDSKGAEDLEFKFAILDAASALEALVAVPGCTFSKLLPFLYYLIIPEFYTADAPDWAIGGARPSHRGGMVSAFVTYICVHALVSLARVHEKTAEFVARVSEIKKRSDQLERIAKIENLLNLNVTAWLNAEKERLKRSLHTTIRRFCYKTVLPLPEHADPCCDAIKDCLNAIRSQMVKAAKDAEENFKAALNKINEFRDKENPAPEKAQETRETNGETKRFERASTGHDIGKAAIEQAQQNAEDALKVFSSNGWEKDPKQWKQIENGLRKASKEVYDLLRPVKNFLSSVLDRELALASGTSKGQGDIAEMAFAAVAYGTVADEWKDERLSHTVNFLTKGISDRGRFPVSRPFYATKEGDYESPFNAGIIGALAQLLKRRVVTLNEASLVEKMLSFFKDTRAEMGPEEKKGQNSGPVAGGTNQNTRAVPTSEEKKERYGWCLDYIPPPRHTQPLATAIAVRSLALINRMLDDQINARILDHHFSVKRSKDLEKGRDLDSLFYPDYGLCLAPQGICRKESVAILLQKMRAHVEGRKGEKDRKDEELLHSLVLYGPSGTGKTTLAEALAKSCEVPLVEVTPSDIVMGGEAAVERRARAVFDALSLLTRAVILFDEFDPVLWKREVDEGPRNVFAFLTPGMLPKLKLLNEQTKKRSVAYVLVTNRIGYLDEAAIREGRFDEKVGIYPPDLLSRTGRFLSTTAAFIENMENAEAESVKGRLSEIIRETKGAGMNALAHKGWFNCLDFEEKTPPKDTPLAYFLGDGTKPAWPKAKAKLEYNGIEDRNEDKRSPYADLEFRQWAWVEEWDKKLDPVSNDLNINEQNRLTEAISHPPNDVPPFPWEKSGASIMILMMTGRRDR